MTLQDIFDSTAKNPSIIIFFFLAIPILSAVFTWIGRGESDKSPWKYIFSGLVFLAAIPGIFAGTLCVYNFLFLRANLLEVNIIVYFIPIISMILTLGIIRREVSLSALPGFDNLTGLLMMITAIIFVMFLLDRTHIIAFVSIPVQYLLGILILAFFLFRFGIKRLVRR